MSFHPKIKLFSSFYKYYWLKHFSFLIEHLNETIAILALVYLGGALAALLRAWLFTLSGQRLVARIRKQVSTM